MEQAGGFLKWLTDYLFELLFALSYGFVLYTIYFKRNSSYKRWALDETKDGYQTKNLFIRFMKIHGKWDFLIYYIYSLIVALLSLFRFFLQRNTVSLSSLLFATGIKTDFTDKSA